ncbi:MAG: VOC family protein [bacterium]
MSVSRVQHTNPIYIKAIDHIVIRIAELEKMLEFYCGVLGCVVERRQEEIGLIQLRAGDALIDLVPVNGMLGAQGGKAPGNEGRNLDHFCLRLAQFDADDISHYLEKKGVSVGDVESRYGAEGHGPSIYINDPEGNVVELKGS